MNLKDHFLFENLYENSYDTIDELILIYAQQNKMRNSSGKWE